MATMKRCRAQLSLSGPWGTEHLWDGLEVDVDRELAPGFTVGQAIAGRDDCFDDVDGADPIDHEHRDDRGREAAAGVDDAESELV